MALFNANYGFVSLSAGTYGVNVLGNGITASTVHQIYCITSGSLTISASGGGVQTLSMTSGQTIDCMVRSVTVTSGTYLGFRSKLNQNSIVGSLYS